MTYLSHFNKGTTASFLFTLISSSTLKPSSPHYRYHHFLVVKSIIEASNPQQTHLQVHQWGSLIKIQDQRKYAQYKKLNNSLLALHTVIARQDEITETTPKNMTNSWCYQQPNMWICFRIVTLSCACFCFFCPPAVRKIGKVRLSQGQQHQSAYLYIPNPLCP